MKNILLFEMFSHGHSINSLELLLKSNAFSEFCKTREQRITVLISDKVEKDLSGILDEVKAYINVRTFKTLDSMSSWKSRFSALMYLITELRGNRYDKVIVLEGDLLCFFAPLIRAFSLRNKILYLFFRPIMHYRSEGYPYQLYRGRQYYAPLIKNWMSMFFCRLGFISEVLFEDQGAVDWCQRRQIRSRQLITPGISVPDGKVKSSGKMCFTLFGVLSEAKSVSTVMRAWSNVPFDLRKNARLQVIGSCLEEDRASIYQTFKAINDETVSFEDRFVTNDEVTNLFSDSDVMLLLYTSRHVGGSGVLVQSASFGLPVLATNIGWVGHTTKKYELGEVIDSGNEASLSQVFSRCISNGVNFNTEKACEFSRKYTPEEYAKSFISILSEDI